MKKLIKSPILPIAAAAYTAFSLTLSVVFAITLKEGFGLKGGKADE